MEPDPQTIHMHTPGLLENSTAGMLTAIVPENLADVWHAAEMLASPEFDIRWVGVNRLVELDAVRTSPLIAYLFVSRLLESSIELRARVVESLAAVMCSSDRGEALHPGVYSSLLSSLAAMRTRPVYALLQVAAFDARTEPMVASLLSYCSYGGDHLAEILANRDAPIEVRMQAVYFIGRLGFLDALPTLERLAARLEQRLNGRGAILEDYDEATLLLEMRQAIEILKAP